MDIQLPEKFIKRQRNKKVLAFLSAALLILLAYAGIRLSLNPGIDKNSIIIAAAGIGTIEASISASGQVVPGYEQVITSPIATNILSIYHKAGERIKKGISS